MLLNAKTFKSDTPVYVEVDYWQIVNNNISQDISGRPQSVEKEAKVLVQSLDSKSNICKMFSPKNNIVYWCERTYNISQY